MGRYVRALAIILVCFSILWGAEETYAVKKSGTFSSQTYIITIDSDVSSLLDGYELDIQQNGFFGWGDATALRLDDHEWMDLDQIKEDLEDAGLGGSIQIEKEEVWRQRIRNDTPRVTLKELKDLMESGDIPGGKVAWKTCNGPRTESLVRPFRVTSTAFVSLGDTDEDDPAATGGVIEVDGSVFPDQHELIVDNETGGSGPGGVPTALDCAQRLITLMYSEPKLRHRYILNLAAAGDPNFEDAHKQFQNIIRDELKKLASTAANVYIIGIQLIPAVGQGASIAIAINDIENGNYLEAALNLFPLAIGAAAKAGKVAKIAIVGAGGKVVNFTAKQAQDVSAIISDTTLTYVDKVRRLTRVCNVQQLPLFMAKYLCFPGDTLVHTPGGLKRIDSLQSGDTVFAYAEESGKQYQTSIDRVSTATATRVVDLHLYTEGGAESEVVTATHDHPFLVRRDRTYYWLEAGLLRPGDELYGNAGKILLVGSVGLRFEETLVYSLTLNKWHTYAVGSIGAIVHNHKCWRDFSNEFRSLFGNSWGKLFSFRHAERALADEAEAALLALWNSGSKGRRTVGAALRRNLGFGKHHHEWLPINNYGKILNNINYSQGELEILVGLIGQLRSHTSVIKFTKKAVNGKVPGHISSGFFFTKHSKEFHDGLNAAFLKHLKPGNVNTAGVRAFMDDIYAHTGKFMKNSDRAKLFGPRVTNAASLAKAEKFTYTVNKTNGGDYYPLFAVAQKVLDDVDAALGPAIRP